MTDNLTRLKMLYQIANGDYREALKWAINELEVKHKTVAKTYFSYSEIERMGIGAAIEEARQKLTDILDLEEPLYDSDLVIKVRSTDFEFMGIRECTEDELWLVNHYGLNHYDKTLPSDILDGIRSEVNINEFNREDK